MKPAPIYLNNYFITELSITARESFDSEKEINAKMEEFNVQEEVQKIENKDLDGSFWQVVLTVSQQPAAESNFPYEFRIVIVGLFELFAKELSEDKQEKIIRINGSSMLYGSVREIIKANTGRGPYESVVVPTVSFYEPNGESKAHK
jgi:preprotein translocase subunit SecB